MAHNIQILENGDACFVECTHYGEIAPAWHGLGEKFNDPMTIEFAMGKSHADFEVSKQPVVGLTPELVTLMNSGEMINASELRKHIIDNYTCNMRLDNKQVCAITSDKYGLIQNVEAFHFINNICGVDENSPVIDTMGVLEDGTTFASIRMKSIYDLGKGDEVDMYLIVRNSFNNKEAFSVFASPIRVCCSNTLNASFRGCYAKKVFKHTKNVGSRLDAELAAKTLGFYDMYKEAFTANMERLKTIKLTDKDCEKIICKSLMSDDVFKIYEKSGFNLGCEDLSTRTKNSIANALEVLNVGIGQRECADKGTGLWLYNGITTLHANHLQYKTQEKKFDSIFGGSADEHQQKAFNEILKLVA